MKSNSQALINLLIEQIKSRTHDYPELVRAHHWTFDLRSVPEGPIEFIVLGINPGETKEETAARRRLNAPQEETSRDDFRRDSKRPANSTKWLARASTLLDGRTYTLTEIFFWSSSRSGSEFQARYGQSVTDSPHLAFCAKMNAQLIDIYKPKAIIAPGFGHIPICERLYGIVRQAAPVTRPGSNKRLVEHFHDGLRPWIFTKHWSGAYGFSKQDAETIHKEIRRITAA